MEPRIRYATTSDGVHIAYWTIGEGPALVYMPTIPYCHVQLEWQMPEIRAWYEALAQGHTLVRYDSRGFGLSDRDVTAFSPEAHIRDIEAVVAALGLETFALYASGDIGMTALRYAAENRQRVSQLILWATWARRAGVSEAQSRALRALLEQDWHIYTQTAARLLLGWANEDAARRFADFYRECATPEIVRLLVPTVYEQDSTEYLAQIGCPALIMHRREVAALNTDVARGLAAAIPGSRFVLLEGASPLPFQDMTEIVNTIHEFLGDPVAAQQQAQAPDVASTSPVTILFTDIEGSTRLTQRLGDQRAQDVLRVHNDIVRRALGAHAGREIKHTGDGIMASFRAASAAIQCAIDIQRGMEEQAAIPSDSAIRVRIGVNSGEPVAEGGDYFGTSVQLAARICEMAEAGQILVSGVVRDLAAGKGFLFSEHGESVLRGFEDSVRLYEVSWAG